MKYYTLRIYSKNGTTTKNITEFDSLDAAEIQYHKNLAADIGNSDIDHVLCMVLDQDGSIYYSRSWYAETEEV